MPASLPAETHNPAGVSSADGVAAQVMPGAKSYALPVGWEEIPELPQAVALRIRPQPGTLLGATQPAAALR